MVEKVDPQADPTLPETNSSPTPSALPDGMQQLGSHLIDYFFSRITSLPPDVLDARLNDFAFYDPDNIHLYNDIRQAFQFDPNPIRHYLDIKALERDLSRRTPSEVERFVSNLVFLANSETEDIKEYRSRSDEYRVAHRKLPINRRPGTEAPAVASAVSQTESMTQPTPSRYIFIPRHAVISLCAAIGFWTFLVSMASLTTHAFPWPLAVIAGFGLLPLAISGGIQRRA